jgi:hypothetical protein
MSASQGLVRWNVGVSLVGGQERVEFFREPSSADDVDLVVTELLEVVLEAADVEWRALDASRVTGLRAHGIQG